MKHFDFKTLAMGAALAGAMLTTNAVQAQDELGLKDVNIVTLQWNGSGRYAGFNGGTGWDNLVGSFGGPGGGNGRIGIVKKTDGTSWALATQGLYLTISADGKMGNATSLDDATGFTITKNAEGELQFKSDNFYLNGSGNGGANNIGVGTEIGENDGFKLNSYNGYASANQNLYQVSDGVYMAPLCLPYNVTVPTNFKGYTVSLGNNELTTTEVTDVPAGTPFICVGSASPVALTIPQENQAYVTPAVSTTALTGWYLNSSTDFSFAIENNVFGFYTDKAHAKAKDVNTAGISKTVADQLGATSFTWDAANNKLVANNPASEAIQLVETLKGLKANSGDTPGQYNVTEASVATVTDGWTIWSNLENYDEQSEYSGKTEADIDALKENFTKLIAAVKLTKTLKDVEIVTLQWPDKRTVGFNGGERTWAAPYSMGTPNNANARVAIVKRTDGKYAVACQGLFIKVTGQGNTLSDERITDPNEATGFNVTRTSENGLTFKTDDGWYLYHPGTDLQATNDESQITDDFRLNTFGDYAIAKEDIYQVSDNLWMSAVCVPFKVSMPTGEGYHAYTVTVEEGALKTTELTGTIDAGVPFIVVSPNGNQIYLNIPQENQAYAAPSTTTAMKGWYQFYQNGADDTPKNFYFDIRDGKFGFYTDANANRKVNQAAISASVATQLNAGAFVWNTATNQFDIIPPKTVKYEAYYNNELIKSETVSVPEGTAPAIPASLDAAFATETMTDAPATITADCTIRVEITNWELPFELSEEIDGGTNWIWYNLGIRNQHWVRVQDSAPYQPIVWGDVEYATLSSAEYQWAFMMKNPYEIYIYNRSNTAQTLGVVNDDYVKMLDEKTAWELLEQGADGFVLRKPGTTNWYLNQNGGDGNGRDLKFWKNDGGRNDGGSTFKVYAADHVRNVKSDNSYGTICLPYATAVPEGVTFYSIVGLNAEKTEIQLSSVDTPSAGVAYVFLAEKAGDIAFVRTNDERVENPEANSNGLVGTFTDYSPAAGTTFADEFYYLLSNNEWMKVHQSHAGYVGILRYRAYLDLNQIATVNPSANAQKSMSIGGNGGANSIEEVLNGLNNGGNGEIYTVTGQRVSNPAKGIYIQNGKKYIVK